MYVSRALVCDKTFWANLSAGIALRDNNSGNEKERERKRVMKREKEREEGAEDNVTLTERLMCSAAL